MTADALRLILDDDLTIEVPNCSVHVDSEPTRDVYVVHAGAEDLLEVLVPKLGPRGRSRATETPEEHTRGDTTMMRVHNHDLDPSCPETRDEVGGLVGRCVRPDLFKALGHRPAEPEDPPAVAWWLADAREVAEATMPKAVEYGSIELVEAGRTLARLMGRPNVSDQEAMEVQIYQYVMGKMGRWTAAMSRGERVSDDTVFDILVYATMVRKIRQTGEWP